VKIFEASRRRLSAAGRRALPPADGSGRVGTSLDRYEAAEELALGSRPQADLVSGMSTAR
jgi:hypothetical protein